MQYQRMWSDEEGESHVDRVEVAFNPFRDYPPGVPVVELSADRPAHAVHFWRADPRPAGDWHTAPRRMLVVMISGRCEMETSDGTCVVCVPGTVVLLEDTTGKGHVTRIAGDEPAVVLRVVLDAD